MPWTSNRVCLIALTRNSFFIKLRKILNVSSEFTIQYQFRIYDTISVQNLQYNISSESTIQYQFRIYNTISIQNLRNNIMQFRIYNTITVQNLQYNISSESTIQYQFRIFNTISVQNLLYSISSECTIQYQFRIYKFKYQFRMYSTISVQKIRIYKFKYQHPQIQIPTPTDSTHNSQKIYPSSELPKFSVGPEELSSIHSHFEWFQFRNSPSHRASCLPNVLKMLTNIWIWNGWEILCWEHVSSTD